MVMKLTLLLSIVLLITLHSKAGYVWEGKPIIMPVYHRRPATVLYSSLGSGKLAPRHDRIRRSAHPTYPNKLNSRSHLIPPSFVTSAHVQLDTPEFRQKLLSKPKRWALATANEPKTVPPAQSEQEPEPFSLLHNNPSVDGESSYPSRENKTTVSDNEGQNEILSQGPVTVETAPKMTSYISKIPDGQSEENMYQRSYMEPSEYSVDDRFPQPYDYYPDEDNSDMTRYQSPYTNPNPPETTRYRYGDNYPDHQMGSYVRDQRPFVDGNKKRYDGVPQFNPSLVGSYRLQVEEETPEPMRPVRRSPSPWTSRDVQRLGQPRFEACMQPVDRGVGPDEISSWYYEPNEHRCRWFGYRGHGGNANRFYSRTACEAYCIRDLENMCEAVSCSWKGTRCVMMGDEVCKENERRYGRDPRLKCPPDQAVCLSRRNTRMAPDINFQPIPSECFQPKDGGSCERKNPAVNFYYDRERNTCMTFYYHRCGGNDNRFETKSDCMTQCSP